MSQDRGASEGIKTQKGAFRRQVQAFRNVIEADPAAEFAAEAGRYHLYVSSACPWAHRAMIMRKLRGLEDVISMDIVDYFRDRRGWAFTGRPGGTLDTVNGKDFLLELYLDVDPHFAQRPTTPTLWDKKKKTIVNNESPDIIRMLDVGFAGLGDTAVNLYPEAHRSEIDSHIPRLYDAINNGVYKCGFASTEEAYAAAYDALFSALDEYDALLADRRFLCGDLLTEADICLFVTLIRFDVVYYSHFKTNKKHIHQYANLWRYTREIYQLPGVKETVDFDHIKGHYFQTHQWLNPSGIVPIGPELNFDEPVD